MKKINVEDLVESDMNITSNDILVTPHQIKSEIPLNEKTRKTVLEGRRDMMNILAGYNSRMFMLVGPCSIHDYDQAIEYANKLKIVSDKVGDKILIGMRTYFEKPRTTKGWQGIVQDPYIDGSDNISEGLRLSRRVAKSVTKIGLPITVEVLGSRSYQFIDDLVTIGSIGARTVQSQSHREVASGLSVPIGFKNSTTGDYQVAVDALSFATRPHVFPGMNEYGELTRVSTKGNQYGFVILRGGDDGTNYDSEVIESVSNLIKNLGDNLINRVVVDCSHQNSRKIARNQIEVLESIVAYKNEGLPIAGCMIESNLHTGKQSLSDNLDRTSKRNLKYGISLTDECLGFVSTEKAILSAYDKLH